MNILRIMGYGRIEKSRAQLTSCNHVVMAANTSTSSSVVSSSESSSNSELCETTHAPI